MNLNHLAPDIQEEVLMLSRVTNGREPIHESMFRPIVAETCWHKQRKRWCALSPTPISAV